MSHNVHGLMVNRSVCCFCFVCYQAICAKALISYSIFSTLQEAERLELENASRLLETRRLSLIVDLDQTIIHAACDPTVGEWMNDKNNKNHPATKVSCSSPVMYYKHPV
jgi:TFIIF-interacting CTD phosphatase-like protein